MLSLAAGITGGLHSFSPSVLFLGFTSCIAAVCQGHGRVT